MKTVKLNPILLVFLLSALSAYATSEQANFVSECSTTPISTGANIDNECPYNANIYCCYLAQGSSSLYVIQKRGAGYVTIRKSTSSIVTIFGTKL